MAIWDEFIYAHIKILCAPVGGQIYTSSLSNIIHLASLWVARESSFVVISIRDKLKSISAVNSCLNSRFFSATAQLYNRNHHQLKMKSSISLMFFLRKAGFFVIWMSFSSSLASFSCFPCCCFFKLFQFISTGLSLTHINDVIWKTDIAIISCLFYCLYLPLRPYLKPLEEGLIFSGRIFPTVLCV